MEGRVRAGGSVTVIASEASQIASLAMTSKTTFVPHAALRPLTSRANTTASAEAIVYIMKALR